MRITNKLKNKFENTGITLTQLLSALGDHKPTSRNLAAFMDCTSLTSVLLPNGVTEINIMAFYECKSLASVTIPDGVTFLGV